MNHIESIFLAGWCADAAGASLEFQRHRFSEQEVIKALHNTTGIITDDSEMEIALLDALTQGRNDEYFPVDRIAQNYIAWYNSDPPDMGQTIMFALHGAINAETMYMSAQENNAWSESNGSLMRCVPLAMFLINKSVETIMQLVELEVALTHPSPIVALVTGVYCCILSKTPPVLLKPDVASLKDDILNIIKTEPKVFAWYEEACALESLDNYDAITNEGHVKHAFIFVIYFWKNLDRYTYETAIKEVLMCGGDTDTNAKIVGNLFGAYYGNCVPEYMLKNVQSRRPYEYTVKKGLELIQMFKPK